MPELLTFNEWRGDAPGDVQVITITVTTAVENALYGIDLPTISARYRAVQVDTVATIARALGDALAGGNFSVEVAREVIILTGTEPGVPFGKQMRLLNTPNCYVENSQSGRVPVSQELTITIPAGTTGGTWTLSCNFGSGAEVATGLAWNISSADLQAALIALATPVDGDIEVQLVSTSPRRFSVKVTGALAGVAVTMTSNASGLTGHAKAEVTRVQWPGSNTPAVWFLRFENSTSITMTIDGDTQVYTVFQLQSSSFWEAKLGVAPLKMVMQSALSLRYLALTVMSGADIEIQGSGLLTGNNCSVRLQQYQSVHDNNFQFLPYDFVGGNVSYTLGAFTSTAVSNFSSLATQLRTHLSVGANDVKFYNWAGAGSQSALCPALFYFTGALQDTTQTLMTASKPSGPALSAQPTMVSAGGSPPLPETQTLAITASGGTFDLGYSSESETGIAWNVSAATLGGILEDLTGLEYETELDEGFTVSGSGTPIDPFVITFSLDATVSLLTVNGGSLTGGATITPLTNVPADPGADSIQTVHVDPFALGGSIRLALGTVATGDILWNADAETWTAALVAALGPGSAVASGLPVSMRIQFTGPAGKRPQPLLVIYQDTLSVGASQLEATVVKLATGDNWWNNPLNWTLGHAPTSGEIAVLGSGRSQITQGLTQSSECVFSGKNVVVKEADFVPGQVVRFRTTGSFPTQDGEMPETGPELPTLNISTVVNGAGAATDSFTDADSTAIADHTSETGHTWLAPAVGSAVINDNKLRVTAPPSPSNPPTIVFLDGEFGADAVVSLKRDTVPTAAGRYGILLRYLDNDNYIAAICIANGSQFGLTPGILKREAGEDDWMGSLGTGQTATVLQMSVTMSGNNISFTTDDGTSSQTTSATTSFLAGNQKRGIYCYGNFGGSSAVVDFDNFSCSIAEGSDEIQSVWTDAEAGEFTLTDPDNDETSAGIPFDASAAVVQAELEEVYGAGNVAVTGDGTEDSPWLIAFQGELAATALTEMTGDNSALEYIYADGMDSETDYLILAAQARVDGGQVLLIKTADSEDEDQNPLEFENAGTGIHRVSVQLKGLQQYARFTGQVGLPRRDNSAAWIDVPRFLAIDFEDPQNGKPNLEIGVGLGDGSSRMMIDAGPAYLDARVVKSQQGTNEPAIQIGNRNLANSELLLISGDVGLAIEATAQVAMKRIVAFGGSLQAGNVDYQQLEDYAQAVRSVVGQANADVVELRMR